MLPALILIPTIIGVFTSFSLGHFGICQLEDKKFFSSTSKGEGKAGVPYEMWKKGIGLCSLDCVGLECCAPECPFERQRMSLMLILLFGSY